MTKSKLIGIPKIRLLSSGANERGRNTLRKQLSPLLKLIHPDFFSRHHTKIQQDNMQFLQSLNSLIDNLELLHASSLKRSTCDVTSPLLSSYNLKFHVKLDSPDTGRREDSIPETRAVSLVLRVPQDLTFRQTMSSTIIKKRISKLLHDIGPVFEAVGMQSPWDLVDTSDQEEKMMPWERTSGGHSRPTSSASPQGFHKRRASVSIDDPAIRAVMEEKMVEKAMAGNVTSIFGGADNSRLIKGDVDKYIRNGNVLTTNLSPVDQLRIMKRVRDFFLKFGHLVNFSFDIWNRVLILIDGSQVKNTFSKENLKKRIIVVIPPKFQSALLVQYLHKDVPEARVVLPGMIDGMKSE